MRVRIVRSGSELSALAPAWRALAAHASRPSPFLCHEWIDAAWQWRREGASLHVLACERGGSLVGVLPLARPKDDAAVGRALEALTVPDTQLCDVLAARGEEQAVAEALASHLAARARDWDVLRLPGLRRGSCALERLAPMLQACEARRVDAKPGIEAWVRLDEPWDAWFARRSRRARKAANLARNRVARGGDAVVRWRAGASLGERDLPALAHALTAVSAASWKRRTGYSFERPGPQAYLQRLLAHASDRGWLSVWTLEQDGRAIATELQLVHEGDVYGLRADYDPAHAARSPGSHLQAALLRGLMGLGYGRYRMGPGDNAYKFRWNDGADPVHAVALYSPTLRGRALEAWETRVVPAARRLVTPKAASPLPKSGPALRGQ